MASNNILFARIICPSCESIVEAEIEMGFGDTRQRYEYTVGDRYDWRPHASLQNGGRPENGDLDGEGQTHCPECGDNVPLKILIHNDIISDVVFDYDRNINDNIPSPFYAHQTAEAMQIPQHEPDVPQKGEVKFDFDEGWLTAQRRGILSQLTDHGVSIYAPNSTSRGLDFRIMIPHNHHPKDYIEIAYLMAQLVDEKFSHPPVEYVDSYPHGVKYRVRSSDGEQQC